MSLLNNNNLTTQPNNVTSEFRETFKTYDTSNTWSQVTGSGDIVQLDGNAASARYLVISKDPLSTGTETIVETRVSFTGPLETAVGLSMSQRPLGQETSLELVSTDTPLTSAADLAISIISQTATIVSVATVNPHGLSVGQRIGIYGVTANSILNYPALVVATVVSSTQFTATAGPGGTVNSTGAGPHNNQGYVFYRPAMGYAPEGMSQVFENTSATNSSMYVRSDSGDVYPSGTAAGNHSVTIGSTSSVALAAGAPYTYAFIPTNEYKFILQSDRAQFYDSAADATSQPAARLNRATVVPSLSKTYKLRFRATNSKALPVPVAKIVSAAKSGTTTATITTESPHGLTTGDIINIYGIGDTTNFPNTVSGNYVLTTPTSTTFTFVIAGAVTATSAGGFVSRQQGGQGIQNIQATVAAQASSTTTQLTLIGSASWSLNIGDYVNVYGLRNRATGADLGFDGAYKVVDQATSTLVLEPLTGTTLPAALTLTNTGGAVIKRTDTRISYARINQYLRERVELLNKSDAFSAVPVLVNGGTVTTVSTVTAVTAVNSSLTAVNAVVADSASGAVTTTATGTTVTPSAGALAQEYNVIVTAVTGTTPTLDYVVQESDDGGTSWYDTYHFPRITATGQYRSPLIPFTGNRVRISPTITGTTPSFTRSINRVQSNISVPLQRQFFDRTIAPNTASSVTPSFFTEGCVDFNVVVAMGAVTTTAPVLVIEVSADNANWVQVGADITTVASTNNLVQLTNVLARFTRLRVKTAGTGATLTYVMVKGIGK